MGIAVIPLARSAYVTFANGDREEIVGEAYVGEISVLVADVVEPLLSAVDLVDSGHYVVMSSSGGLVTSNLTGETTELRRIAGQWKMKMEDLISLESSSAPAIDPHTIDDYRASYSVIGLTPEGDHLQKIDHAVYSATTTEAGRVRKRVIELHRRMGCATAVAHHRSEMCVAKQRSHLRTD